MKKFTVEHAFDCDPDTLWLTFFDEAFTKAQFASFGFPSFEIVSQKDEGDRVVRTMRVTPKLEVPGAVAKLLGSSFAYTEEGTFDKAAKVWTWKTTTSVLPNKIHSHGTVRVLPAGAGKCIQKSEFEISVDVFGVGGAIESALEKNFTNGWNNGATFTRRWLAGARS